jgi:mannose-6-phosphate isomerase-like protein (cupin superfamily)
MIRVSSESGSFKKVIDGFFHKTLAVGEMMSMQKFKIEPKNKLGSKHNHVNSQMVYIVEGEGLTWLTYDNKGENIKDTIDLMPGDSIYVPPNEYHNAVNKGNEAVVGIDVFCPPRANPTPEYMKKD